MSKDDLNVGDGKRMEEPKEREKEASLKMKRKPPKEMMKGGIRDRPLFSWIRILGWFFLFQLLIDSSLLLLTPYSVVAAIWWAFIIGFLVCCFAIMCVSISMIMSFLI